MAAPVYSDIPRNVTQGDAYTWTRSYGDYPSSTWTLKYHFRALETTANKARFTGTVADRRVDAIDVTASTSGSGFSITLTSTVSAGLTPGRWRWAARVTSGSEAHTLESGEIIVAADLQAQTDGTYDPRTEHEYQLEQVTAAMSALTTGKVKSYTIADRTFTFNDLGELRKQAGYLRTLIAREKGLGPQTMLVRFRGVA